MTEEQAVMEPMGITETALIKINPYNEEYVCKLRDEALALATYAGLLNIEDDAAVRTATNDLSVLSKCKKAIELKRREYIDPISTHMAEVNMVFKSITAPLDEAEKTTKGKILAYKQAQEAKRAQIEEANRLRMEAARIEAAANGTGEISQSVIESPLPLSPANTTHADMGSASTVKLRKWRLADIRQVPAEYLKVDEVQIGKLVRAGIPAIPGIEIYVEETLRINAKGEI